MRGGRSWGNQVEAGRSCHNDWCPQVGMMWWTGVDRFLAQTDLPRQRYKQDVHVTMEATLATTSNCGG